jgi:hypothetical protein
VRFSREPAADNATINGRYRLPGRAAWSAFRFAKGDEDRPRYQLSIPATVVDDRPRTLSYSVPAHEVLDRVYVLRALGEIYGCTDWRDVTPEGKAT